MRVKIFGNSSSVSKQETRYLVSWMGEKLLSKKHFQEVSINVVFKKDFCSKTGNIGEITGLADVLLDTHRKFRLTVERDIFSRKRIISTIAHEMVHVKQLVKGEMSFDLLPHSWRGPKNYKTNNSTEYYDFPWEIEAYGREEFLTVQYMEHVRKEKLKFAD